MLELYNAPISTCSQKVRMSLAEKQLEWVDHTLVFSKFEHLTPEYLKLNPNGVVPTLLHDGGVVVDSSVINEYLEDAFPERPLRPSNKIELAHMRAWRQYIDEVPTPSIRYPSFNAYFVMKYGDFTDEEFQAHAERLPVRRDFYLKMGRTGFPQAEVDAAIQRLRDTLERMERALEKTEWLANDMFTLADISIMPSIVRMEDLYLQGQWKDLPRVTDWYRRLQARPAFATTYFPGTRDLGPTC
ncbi:glutathione S-transferase family protein [Hydrogenophaga sp.]|uniref:glutathione S-transferase family protein n=1 Tax=Hydrogenophaga sp. TaxID=1904254 RepID=UPI003568F800